jgi:hypothetical protein
LKNKLSSMITALTGFGDKVDKATEAADVLAAAASEVARVTGIPMEEAEFIIEQVSVLEGDLQLIDGKIVIDLPDGDPKGQIEFQRALQARQHKTALLPGGLTDYDVSELQEASRQASAMLGITHRQAMTSLMNIGRRTGKIGQHVKMPRAVMHEVKPCLMCSKDKQHSNAFCSGDCARQYKKEAVVKDRIGRTIRPGMSVEVMDGTDDGRILTVQSVEPDHQPCPNRGYWINCRDERHKLCGIMSGMVEVWDGESYTEE